MKRRLPMKTAMVGLLVAPAATKTEAGTVPAGEFDERLMSRPPAGAGLERVTVPVALAALPPTEAGAIVRSCRD